MDRTRRGLRKAYMWVRAVIAVVLMGLFVWTLYQNYIVGDNDDTTLATTTTATTVAGGDDTAGLNVTVNGPVPQERVTARVASSAVANPASFLTDGDPSTAWACSPCVNADSPGIGETITFDLGGEVSLESIRIRNGFPEGAGFLTNNRIQRVQFDLGSGPLEATLPDTSQIVTIEVAGATTQVTLSVLSIYQSGEGGGFGISDVTFIGSYSP